MLYSDRYFSTDWQFEMFKIGKDNDHGTRFKCKLKTSFLIFSNILNPLGVDFVRIYAVDLSGSNVAEWLNVV